MSRRYRGHYIFEHNGEGDSSNPIDVDMDDEHDEHEHESIAERDFVFRLGA